MGLRMSRTVLFLLFALPGVAAPDIVVLTTGERMDVASYEIQEHAVVVKTWDGRLRALPRAYVDLTATEAANAGAKPEQEIAPARLARARQLCEDYGVRNAVSNYYEALDGQIQKLRGHVAIRDYDQLRAQFRSAFDEDRIFDAVVASFAENANADLLAAWSEFLATPLAKRMVTMENTELEGESVDEARRYYNRLQANARVYKKRVDLVNRLDAARKSTESGIEVVLHLVEAYYEAAKKVFPDQNITFDAEAMRRTLLPTMKQANLQGSILLFRQASDDDLDKYIAYWSSRDGKRVVSLMNAAIESGARKASTVAMEMVTGKRHTVP